MILSILATITSVDLSLTELILLIMALKQSHKLCVVVLMNMRRVDLQIEVLTEFLFQKAGCAADFERSSRHYSHAISQILCLVHVMRRQDNYLVFLGSFDDLPGLSARRRVHP